MVHHVHSEEEYNKLKDTKEKLVVVDFSASWFVFSFSFVLSINSYSLSKIPL